MSGLPRFLTARPFVADGEAPQDDFSITFILLSFGTLMSVVTLIYVLKNAFSRQAGEIGGWEFRGAWGRVTAIARTTLAEGMRAKVGSGFALLILVSIPIFWFTAVGDGTIKGRIQMFIAYSLGLTSFLLALLTIAFSCRSLSVEIAGRQIYQIISKPIPRWQIVAGKWIGVMTLNVALLALAYAATYLGTRATVSGFKKNLAHELATYGGLTPSQAAQTVANLDEVRGIGKEGIESPVVSAFAKALGITPDEIGDILLRLPEATRVNLRRFDQVRRQVLIARAGAAVQLPDLSEEIQKRYDQLKKENRLPEGWAESRIRGQIAKELATDFCTIPPGEFRTWSVKGPPPKKDADFIMSLRFKINPSGIMTAQTINGVTMEAETMLCGWAFGDPRKANFATIEDFFPVSTFHELEVASQCIEDDGTLVVTFQNRDPRGVDAVFDVANGHLEILYRIGSFELSLFQGYLAMLIPLACLASFGVCASTFLTFPVGVLIVLTCYLIASSLGFIAESLAATPEYVGPNVTLEYEVRRQIVSTLDYALAIGDLDPVAKIIEGRAVGWAALWEKCWKFVLVKGFIVFVIAVLILRRREMAAVIV